MLNTTAYLLSLTTIFKITTVKSYPQTAVEHLKDIPFCIRVYETPFYMWGASLTDFAVPSVVVETPEGVWENCYLGLVNTKNFYNTSVHVTQITQLLKCIKVNDKTSKEGELKEELPAADTAIVAADTAIQPIESSNELLVDENDEENDAEDALARILDEFEAPGLFHRTFGSLEPTTEIGPGAGDEEDDDDEHDDDESR